MRAWTRSIGFAVTHTRYGQLVCCGFSSVKHAYSTCRRGSGQTADGLLSAITKLTHNHHFLTIPLSRCISLRTPCINAHDGVYHMLTSCVCTKQLRLSTELIEAQLPPLSAILYVSHGYQCQTRAGNILVVY